MSDDAPEEPKPRPDARPPEPEEERRREEGRPHRATRLRGVARRIFRELDESRRGEPPPEGDDHERRRIEGRELFVSLLETGDKARTEVVRLLAREVRAYLEALELHKDLHHLLTNYSLEVHASLSLRPLGPDRKGDAVHVGMARKEPGGDEPG